MLAISPSGANLFGIAHSGSPHPLIAGFWTIAAIVAAGVIVAGIWINYRLNRIQRELHDLGKEYYAREQELIGEFKAGIISQSQYRKRHEALLREMREESRRMTDGPPK